MDRPDVLVVAAFAPELAALDPRFATEEGAVAGDLRVASRPVGIGLAAAAAGTAYLVAKLRPRAVLLLGTCGLYPPQPLVIGEVLALRSTVLASSAVIARRAGIPGPMRVALDASTPIVDALVALGARPVRVATTLAVTEADDLAAALVTTLSCEAEHLEAAGVAEACVQARVPFAAVLGVANRVGAPARAQWRAHHREAGDAAARLAERWLVDGAAGLVRN